MREIVIVPLGSTGTGKSFLGCRIIKKNNAFVHCYSPNSVTVRTTIEKGEVDGTMYVYPDIPGFYCSQNNDKFYITDMVETLKNKATHINAFLITINVTNPRFDLNLKMMLTLINYFFNDPNLWKQTALVFTHCFPGAYVKKEVIELFQPEVVKFIKTLPNCQNIDVKLPSFFVDSGNYDVNDSKHNEFDKIREFAASCESISTSNLRVVNPKYMMKEKTMIKRKLMNEETSGTETNLKRTFFYEDQQISKITNWENQVYTKAPKVKRAWKEEQTEILETLNGQLVKVQYQGNGKDKKKILYYEDQKRWKIIDEQNNVVYKEPIKIKDWIHIINSSVVQENKTDEVSRWVEHPGHWERPPKSKRIWWRIGTFGIYGGPKRYVRDPDITHITYHQFRRDKITDPDNNITFTDWIKIGEWTT